MRGRLRGMLFGDAERAEHSNVVSVLVVEVVGTEGSADPVRERGVVRVEFVRVEFGHERLHSADLLGP